MVRHHWELHRHHHKTVWAHHHSHQQVHLHHSPEDLVLQTEWYKGRCQCAHPHRYLRLLGLWSRLRWLLASTIPWPMEWSSVNIMAKELVPIIISCMVWGSLLKQRSTEFHCDIQGLVAVINKGSSKDAVVMHLLRCIWFFTAVFDIHITATHIAGKLNNAADMLSRNQAAKFLKAHLHMPISATPLLPSLLLLVSP